MISPLLAQICKLGHLTPTVFEAPCTVCVKPNAQHMKLPHLGTEVSVCRECCTLKHQVFSMDSKWMGRIGVKGQLEHLISGLEIKIEQLQAALVQLDGNQGTSSISYCCWKRKSLTGHTESCNVGRALALAQKKKPVLQSEVDKLSGEPCGSMGVEEPWPGYKQ